MFLQFNNQTPTRKQITSHKHIKRELQLYYPPPPSVSFLFWDGDKSDSQLVIINNIMRHAESCVHRVVKYSIVFISSNISYKHDGVDGFGQIFLFLIAIYYIIEYSFQSDIKI